MSRRRYISTRISVDPRVADLANQAGPYAALLYTWLIPHADDQGFVSGGARQIKLEVVPGLDALGAAEITQALEVMQELGLISWDGDVVRFPQSFHRHQSYIKESRREVSAGQRETPRVAAFSSFAAKSAQVVAPVSSPVSSPVSVSPPEVPPQTPPRGGSVNGKGRESWVALYDRTHGRTGKRRPGVPREGREYLLSPAAFGISIDTRTLAVELDRFELDTHRHATMDTDCRDDFLAWYREQRSTSVAAQPAELGL